MNENEKMKGFKVFKKFSYREMSRPNQTFLESFKTFKNIFLTNMFKNQYLNDVKYLSSCKELKAEDRKSLKKIYNLNYTNDILVYIYVPSSLLWHYYKKYFSSGSRLIEAYIIAKVFFNVFLLSAISFYVIKYNSDPILYNYYATKEEMWDESSKQKRNEYEDMDKFYDFKNKKREE